ncbi:hypothetical protein CIW48_27295 [Methylobacterium sp. P1-11]|uniref:hypothetical protein n=1 Tax=Methylobacterium sp. P1-11 TaxID=2024616 RepID=UPI0011EE97CF|nr:hypothetical protein [Methylobacterium sp. P1-11]KAA0117908.1 hypothetical protein CIW48_27295 [Methylobacterium sp. P1-11]
MDAQTKSSIRILLLVGLTWLGSHGYGNAKDLATFTDPSVIEAFLSLLGVVGTAIWGLWDRRPHGIIKDAAALPQVDAVVTKPKTAGEIPVANVVGSVDEASRVPGITQG